MNVKYNGNNVVVLLLMRVWAGDPSSNYPYVENRPVRCYGRLHEFRRGPPLSVENNRVRQVTPGVCITQSIKPMTIAYRLTESARGEYIKWHGSRRLSSKLALCNYAGYNHHVQSLNCLDRSNLVLTGGYTGRFVAPLFIV